MYCYFLAYFISRDGANAMQLYNGNDRYLDLLEAIQQRNDTFYVVSFNKVSNTLHCLQCG